MTARGDAPERINSTDTLRRVANLVRLGKVEELDEAKARVRIRAGEFLTDWIQWTAARAGPDRSWSAPEVGEQVILACPSGDMAQAVVLGTVYQDAHPAPANSKDKTRHEWQDGAFEQYDRAAHEYELSVPAGGKIVLRCGASSIEITDAGIKLVGPRIDLN